MLQEVLDASLGPFARCGFSLHEHDDHCLELQHDGEMAYVFGSYVTIPVIHECCRLHLNQYHSGGEKMKGKWLNTEKVISPNVPKPCGKLGYCPYGQMVEDFPFSNNKLSCTIENGAIIPFGHDCPVHYHAEKA